MKRLPVFLAVLLSGCAAPGGPTASRRPRARAKGETAAQRAEKLAALTQREHDPQPLHDVELLGGLASARVEGRVAPRVECKEADSCTVHLEMGDLPLTDEPAEILCMVNTIPLPFGYLLKKGQAGAGLAEVPQLTVSEFGDGLVVEFVAETVFDTEEGPYPGTLKLSALYSGGYTALCFDAHAGGRATFKRVAHGYFKSLKLRANPKLPDVFALGYRSREGDRTGGFLYSVVAHRPGGERGFVEYSTSLGLVTDGKTWSVTDRTRSILRDDRGQPEVYTKLWYFDGAEPMTLSAKPAEGGRFRVKWQSGQRTDALELTPKAPISSELWSSLELRKIARGKRKSFRYAEPSFADGDPTLTYIELSRLGPGVIAERQRMHSELVAGSGKPSAETAVDELHVDPRGVVLKEVTARSVDELIHSSGTLPAGIAKRGRR